MMRTAVFLWGWWSRPPPQFDCRLCLRGSLLTPWYLARGRAQYSFPLNVPRREHVSWAAVLQNHSSGQKCVSGKGQEAAQTFVF